jgi:Tol biopolymer transport system component
VKKNIFLLIVIFSSFLPNHCLSNDKTAVIYYGNGVANTQGEAIISLLNLKTFIKNYKNELYGQGYKTIEFKLSYNPTNGILLDLLESSIQDLGTDVSRFWSILAGFEPMPDFMQETFLEFATTVDETRFVDGSPEVLENHIASYRNAIDNCKTVVLVAHSQGNFFANRAYPKLNIEEQNAFKIVSVANPDSFVADNRNLYTTLTDDLVIEAIRLAKIKAGLLSFPMPAYTTNNFKNIDKLNHGFNTAYLFTRDDNSGIEILSNIISTLKDAETKLGCELNIDPENKGSIEIKRTAENEEMLPPDFLTKAQANDLEEQADNPAFFNNLSISENPYISKATDLPEYKEKVAVCTETDCIPYEYAVCDGSMCSKEVDVLKDKTTSITFLYDDCAEGFTKEENGIHCVKDDIYESSISRVSITNAGVEADGISQNSRINANGRYVTFESAAHNLLPVDIEPAYYRDVYVHDRYTRTTSLVSVKSDGTRGSNSYKYAGLPDISADGRYVVFESSDFLAPENEYSYGYNIYLHDMELGNTSLISIKWDKANPAGSSSDPKISADGRYVTFVSLSKELLTNYQDDPTIAGHDVFVHDISTRTNKLVSVASNGSPANHRSDDPSISADGRYIVFVSNATNLVPGEPLNKSYQEEVFLHDQVTGETSVVSVNSEGERSNGDSRNPEISADGRYVVFESKNSTNIEAGLDRSYNSPDIYVHDRVTGKTTLVSIHNGERGVSDESYNPRISADGRYITFESRARDLIHGITLPGGYKVFIHDQVSKETRLLSYNTGGEPENGGSGNPHISADGNYITFESVSTDLVPGDTNRRKDVFVRYLAH